MAIAATVEIPIDSKDPRDAVLMWLKYLKSSAVEAKQLQIDVALISMANKGVLVRLAEGLPKSALGFTALGASDRAKSASEFLGDSSPSHWSYQGTLTKHLPPLKAIALVEAFLSCPLQAMRSTSFMLNCKGIQWHKEANSISGFLHLFDFKFLKRKQRFSLTAGLTCAGNEPKSTEVLSKLKSVAQLTGIPFNEGDIREVADENRDSALYAKALLIGQVCFDEAIEHAADTLNKQSNSPWAKSALSPSDAFGLRMSSWGDGNSEKVNFVPVAKQVVKSNLSEFVFDTSDAERVRFKKPLTAGAEVALVFEKSLPRLGKAFTVKIGVQSTDNSMTGVDFETNLFCLERTREERSWIYSTRDEAVASVRISIDALKSMLPSFESALKLYF